VLRCQTCEASLCAECDDSSHTTKLKKRHKREPLPGSAAERRDDGREDVDVDVPREPEEIIEQRGADKKVEYLVRWRGYPTSAATWENGTAKLKVVIAAFREPKPGEMEGAKPAVRSSGGTASVAISACPQRPCGCAARPLLC
jgi:hypothetical protein